MKLSILTPAVPSRLSQLEALCSELGRQIGGSPAEHLTLIDNKRRTVGEKRDALLRAARGAYVAYVDDDDWISQDYIASLLTAIEHGPDVVTFRQVAAVNEQVAEVEFRLGRANEPFRDGATIRRAAWHVCAWRRSLAILSRFPASSYGEDWAFAAPLNAIAKTEEHIPRVLHYYKHSAATTEAPHP
jgi:hypothetical protein